MRKRDGGQAGRAQGRADHARAALSARGSDADDDGVLQDDGVDPRVPQ